MVYTIIVHLYAKADEESISKLKAKLVEASQVYSQDKETLSWFVMQDTVDPRKFSIVERYLQESVCSSKYFIAHQQMNNHAQHSRNIKANKYPSPSSIT